MDTYTFDITTLDSGGAVESVIVDAATPEAAVEELKVRYPEITGWQLRE